jgi:hypothetical protein
VLRSINTLICFGLLVGLHKMGFVAPATVGGTLANEKLGIPGTTPPLHTRRLMPAAALTRATRSGTDDRGVSIARIQERRPRIIPNTRPRA